MRSISNWAIILLVLFAIFPAPQCVAFLVLTSGTATSITSTITSISLRPYYRSNRLLAGIANDDEVFGEEHPLSYNKIGAVMLAMGDNVGALCCKINDSKCPTRP